MLMIAGWAQSLAEYADTELCVLLHNVGYVLHWPSLPILVPLSTIGGSLWSRSQKRHEGYFESCVSSASGS